jgi:hypothetical protein
MNKEKFVVLIFVVSFFSATVVGTVKIWQEIAKQPAPTAQVNPVIANPDLIRRRISGYETLLSKDPQNTEARSGLQLSPGDVTNPYIATENYQLSISILKEYPGRADYKEALVKAKQKIREIRPIDLSLQTEISRTKILLK